MGGPTRGRRSSRAKGHAGGVALKGTATVAASLSFSVGMQVGTTVVNGGPDRERLAVR